MTFVFVDKPVMDGAAASTAGLAEATAQLAQQIRTALTEVVPPGNDPVSLRNAAFVRAYLGNAIAQLTADAGLQDVRATSIAAGAAAYELTDGLNAASLTL